VAPTGFDAAVKITRFSDSRGGMNQMAAKKKAAKKKKK
jgi:hypothetical protein